MSKNTKALADTLVTFLKKKGFVIQRYDSMTSRSVYIKLDYGVCNTIRISDHEGKGNLSYRFNLLTNINKYSANYNTKYPQFYYPVEMANQMVLDILALRKEKIKKYGKEQYKQYMMSNMEKGRNAEKGFWKRAVLI